MLACVTLAYAMSAFVPFRMAQGGSVTAVTMIPFLWFALRRGLRWLCSKASYKVWCVETPAFHPVPFFLDYPLAFGKPPVNGMDASQNLRLSDVAGHRLGYVSRCIFRRLAAVIVPRIFPLSVTSTLLTPLSTMSIAMSESVA